MLVLARLAQSVEHETLNLRVVGSSPTLGALLFKIIIDKMTSEPHEQSYQHSYFIPDIISLLSNYECSCLHMSPWRNWLARSTVNRKVGGSSPPGDGYFCPFLVLTNRSYAIAVGNMLYGFRSVVVITCASHAQGPRFEPGRKHRFDF